MPSTPTNPRKLRRFLENEAYAKDARFWTGRIKSADRLLHSQPVNKQAIGELRRKTRSPQKKNQPKTTIVYLVKFTLIGVPPLSFLKVGITSTSIGVRFQCDAERYLTETVHTTSPLTRRDALALEGSLHRLFCSMQFRPPAPLLSGGNSECFVYSPSLETRIKDVLSTGV